MARGWVLALAVVMIWRADPAIARQQDSSADQAKKAPPAPTIVVTGQKPSVERTVDGTTYDEADNPEGRAGSAVDVLDTVPTVHVARDGKVTVRGNEDVKIYIDGRPSPGTDAVALEAIPGSSIASVTLITNPSAAYDADGSMIVNLTLKKGARDGFHDTEIANVGSRGGADAALDTSFGAHDLVATLNLSVRDAVRRTRNTEHTQLFDDRGDPTQTFSTLSSYTPIHGKSADIAASLTDDLASDADAGVDASFSHSYPIDVVTQIHDDLDDATGVHSIYQRVRTGSYYGNRHDISAHLQRRGSGKAVSAKLIVQDSSHSVVYHRIFTVTDIAPPGDGGVERIDNRSVSRTRLASLDLGRAIGDGVTLSGGGEWRRDGTLRTNDQTGFAADAGPLDFHARQQTDAAYLTARAHSSDWTIDIGARYEHVDIAGQTRPASWDRTYQALNETVSVARQLGSDQILIKASRAKQAIDPDDLDPATIYVDALSRFVGNPALSPQTVTSAEIEYDYTRRAIDSSINLYYRRIDDTIDDFLIFEPDDVTVRTKQNGGPSQSVGATLSLADTIFRTVKYRATVNLFRSQLSVLGQAMRATDSIVSYELQGSLDWQPSKLDRLHFDAEVDGPSLVPQGRQSGTSEVDAVYTRDLSPRLSLTLTAHGLLQQMHVRTTVTSGRAISITDDLTTRRALLAGFSYKLR